VAVPEVHRDLSVEVDHGKVRVASGVEVEASLSLELQAHRSTSVDERATLLSFCYAVPAFALGPVAIPVSVSVAADLGVDASLSAGAVVGLQKQFKAHTRGDHDPDRTAGEEYQSEAAVDATPIEFTPPRLLSEEGIYVKASAGIEASLKLGYSCPVNLVSIGPALSADVYGTLAVSPTDDPWWTLGHGADVTARLEADFMGIHLLDLTCTRSSEPRRAPATATPVH
jgi:hypothetical protein